MTELTLHESGQLTIRGGRGSKDRLTYAVSTKVKAALADWLSIRGDEAGPLFTQLTKMGN